MTTLVTGAFGFVGTNLTKSIKTALNNHIIAVDIQETKNHICDMYVDWEKLEKLDSSNIDAIIHLAGIAHDTKNTTDQKVYFDVNLGLTQKIYNYFIQSNIKKFIFFSSVKAVADQVNGEQLTEEDIPNPKTAYGKSKLAAEKYILAQKLPEDKKVYILRPCMIHGPGNKGNLNLLFRMVQNRIPWILGNFNNKRSFTSIDNLMFIVNQILFKDIEQGIYQIADDEAISTNRLIQIMAESMGKMHRIWNINKKMIQFMAKIGDIVRLPLNSERLIKLTESYVVSNKKIKNALGIERLPINAEEGMKKTLVSFQF
jgi:nucleoside-diphosphate-sugar epimerase